MVSLRRGSGSTALIAFLILAPLQSYSADTFLGMPKDAFDTELNVPHHGSEYPQNYGGSHEDEARTANAALQDVPSSPGPTAGGKSHAVRLLRDVVILLEPRQIASFTDAFLREGGAGDVGALFEALIDLQELPATRCGTAVDACDRRREAYDSALQALNLHRIIESLPEHKVDAFVQDYLRNASPDEERTLLRATGKPLPHSELKKGRPLAFVRNPEASVGPFKRDIHIHLHGGTDGGAISTTEKRAENAVAPALVRRQDVVRELNHQAMQPRSFTFNSNGLTKRDGDRLAKRVPTHYVMPLLPGL